MTRGKGGPHTQPSKGRLAAAKDAFGSETTKRQWGAVFGPPEITPAPKDSATPEGRAPRARRSRRLLEDEETWADDPFAWFVLIAAPIPMLLALVGPVATLVVMSVGLAVLFKFRARVKPARSRRNSRRKQAQPKHDQGVHGATGRSGSRVEEQRHERDEEQASKGGGGDDQGHQESDGEERQ